jgi:hypothetical protein
MRAAARADATPAATSGAAESLKPSALERLALGGGVVAALLYVAAAALFVGAIVPRMPPFDAPAATRAAFYASMHGHPPYQAISYLGEAQLAFLLPFFGGLLGVLRRAEGGSGAVSFSVFAAGVALAVITPLAMLVEDHLLLGFAAAGVDPAIVTTVDGLVPVSFALSGFPQAVVLAGTTAVLRGRGVVPRWTGWLGLGVAALSLAGTATIVAGELFPVSHLASLLTRVWVLALAVSLLRRAA